MQSGLEVVKPYSARKLGSPSASCEERAVLRPVLLGGAVAMDRIFGPDDTRET